MSYDTSSGLCSNDPFLVRTPMTALSKIATLPCVLYLLLALQAHSPSFCLFCQRANLHHQVPLPCGFQLSLADRDPWQRMRGKEEVGMFMPLVGLPGAGLRLAGSSQRRLSLQDLLPVPFWPKGSSIPPVTSPGVLHHTCVFPIACPHLCK